MSAPEASRSPLRHPPGSRRGLFPRLFISDRGRTPSTAAVALLFLCLYSGGGGRGRGGQHISSGGVVHAVDVHGDEHHFDRFTGEEEPPAVATTPVAHVRREARPSPATLDEVEAARYNNSTSTSYNYVVLEPNGAGVGGSEAAGSGGSAGGVLSPGSTSVGGGSHSSHARVGEASSRSKSLRRRRGLPPGRGAPSVKMGLAQEQQQQRRSSARESEQHAAHRTGENVNNAARRESGSSGISGAGSRRTGGALTIQRATASSEYVSGDCGVYKLFDGDLGTFARTSDAQPDPPGIPVNDATGYPVNGIAQKCPWFQLDLGATQTVGIVKLSAPLAVARMRQLLYVLPTHSGGAVGWQLDGDMGSTTGASAGGVRVLVSNTMRDRTTTSAMSEDSGRWAGTAVGSVCPEPPAGTECETILCGNAATCLDRFAVEPFTETQGITDGAGNSAVGTAEVDCDGKEGRYVTIELPGITNSHPDNMLRSLGLTEVRVDEGTTSAAEADAVEEQASEAGTSTLLVIGGVVVLLFAAVGVAFAMGIFEAGPPQPTDAAPEAY